MPRRAKDRSSAVDGNERKLDGPCKKKVDSGDNYVQIIVFVQCPTMYKNIACISDSQEINICRKSIFRVHRIINRCQNIPTIQFQFC